MVEDQWFPGGSDNIEHTVEVPTFSEKSMKTVVKPVLIVMVDILFLVLTMKL